MVSTWIIGSTPLVPHVHPDSSVHFRGEPQSAWMGWMEGALSRVNVRHGEVLSNDPGADHCHALLAITLLGALTHQAVSVARRPAGGGRAFIDRYRSVNSPTFTNVVVLLFVLTSVLGALMYPRYRIDVRTTLEDLQLRSANGVFEIKEHFAALGLGLLPAYWLFWRQPLCP